MNIKAFVLALCHWESFWTFIKNLNHKGSANYFNKMNFIWKKMNISNKSSIMLLTLQMGIFFQCTQNK